MFRMLFFQKYCFQVWGVATPRGFNDLQRYFLANIRNIASLHAASSQQMQMLAHTISILSSKKKYPRTVLKERISKYLTTYGKLKTKSSVPDQLKPEENLEYTIQNTDDSNNWVKKLPPEELVSLCFLYAQVHSKRSVTKETRDFWKSADFAVRSNIKHFSLKDIIIVVFAFARIGYRGEVFWKIMTNSWISSLDKLTKGQIVKLYWSYSRTQKVQNNKGVLDLLEKKIVDLIPVLVHSDFLKVVHSLIVSENRNPRILKAIEDNVMKFAFYGKVGYSIVLTYSLAKLKCYNQQFYEGFIDYFLNYVNVEKKNVNIRDLANTAWSVARISEYSGKTDANPQFWKTIEDKIIENNSTIPIKSLTTLVWSFRKMKKGSNLLWKKFYDNVLAQIDAMNLEYMTIILNALTYMNSNDAQFWKAIEQKIQTLLQNNNLNHFYLSKIIRSLAKLNNSSPELKELLVEKFITLSTDTDKVPLPNGDDVFDYILGFSSLRVENQTLWKALEQLYKARKNQFANEKMRNNCQQILERQLSKRESQGSFWVKKAKINP